MVKYIKLTGMDSGLTFYWKLENNKVYKVDYRVDFFVYKCPFHKCYRQMYFDYLEYNKVKLEVLDSKLAKVLLYD